ncbi:MAG: RibD family protein [Odoribacter splanchnicus]
MMKPYIICHMMASIDGRIDCDMTDKISGNEYYTALELLDCPSQLSGKVTAVMHYARSEHFESREYPVGKPVFYKAVDAGGYAIVADSLGSLLYNGNSLDGKPLLVITSEQATTDYLQLLENAGISYIAVGNGRTDLVRAMDILTREFGVERLVICGGGRINGAFLEAGLLDEVSLQIGAGIDGREGMTAVFDGITDNKRPPVLLHLQSVQRMEGTDTVWMRYTK